MPLELQTLQFKVQTDELLKAKVAIDDMGKSIADLNKLTQDETKSAIAAEKVKQQQAKTAKDVANAKIAEEKATIASTESTNKSTTALERQQKILEYMTQGFSKGQSSILATASAAGAAVKDLEELGKVLQTQRKLIGGDPFDKSMSGLVALTNQYGEIREAIRQYNSATELTRNQTRELARDKERIIEKMKLEGASFSQIKQAIREYNSAYVEAAIKVNGLTRAEKDMERSHRDNINAIRNVQSAEERLFATVSHLNEGISQNTKLNERAALALGSYERNLRVAGVTGEQAAKKLQAFKAAQEKISEHEMSNRAGYVARGIGTQMGDVGVSLASGMNPLTVLIQQGDQIRSLIAQSGLEAAAMGKIMQQAVGSIAVSFKDVGVAIGSFFTASIKTAGTAVVDFVGKYTGMKQGISAYKEEILSLGPPTQRQIAYFKALETASMLAGGALAIAATALVTIGTAMYQSTKANDALLISITTTGASLGLSAQQLSEFANKSNIAGISANTLKGALGELAASGFKNKESLDVVTQAAQKYALVTGKDLNEVMKEYAKVAKEPVEALLEMAKASGLVDVAIITQVNSMVEAGDTAGAVALAIKAYAAAQTKAAEDIENSLSPLGKLYIDLKKEASAAWDSIVNYSQSDDVVDGIRAISAAIAALIGVARVANVTLNPVEMAKRITGSGGSYSDAVNKIYEETTASVNNLLNSKPSTKQSGAASGTPAQAEAEAVSGLLKLRKDYENDWDKHQRKLIEISKLEEKYKKDFAEGSAEQIAGLKEINTLRERELTNYNEKISKSEKGAKALENEAKRLKELADYYNQMAGSNNGTADYTKEYAKSKKDLEILYKSKAISGDAFSFGMSDLEKKQPWYKEYEKEQAAYKKKQDAIKNLNIVSSDFNRTLEQQQTLQEMNLVNQNSNIGLTERERLVKDALSKIEEDRVKNLERINDLVEKASKELTPEETLAYHQKLLNIETKSYETRKEQTAKLAEKTYDASHTFETGWKNAFASYTDAARNSADLGKKAFEDMTNGMTDAFIEFAEKGKVSVKDFANTFIKEMLRAQVKSMFGSAIGNGGNLIGSILGLFGGSSTPAGTSASTVAAFGPSSPSVLSSSGSLSTGFDLGSGLLQKWDGGYTGSGGKYEPAGIVHKGEIVWSQDDIRNAGGVSVVEAMRKGVKGYASGGVVAQEYAARQTSGTTNVEINNYSNEKATAKETVDSRGNRRIEVTIGEMVAGEIRRNGSAVNGAMRNTFGSTPVLAGR